LPKQKLQDKIDMAELDLWHSNSSNFNDQNLKKKTTAATQQITWQSWIEDLRRLMQQESTKDVMHWNWY